MIYVVAPGDTLSGIARLSGSSVAQLQQDNGILPDQPLVPGQALVVPDRDGTASEKPLLSVGGYAYPHIRPGVLQQALPFLTTLSIFSYGFREDGTLVEPSAHWLLQQAGEVGGGIGQVCIHHYVNVRIYFPERLFNGHGLTLPFFLKQRAGTA